MNIMNRLERKLYRLRVEPFFRYIIFAMAGVYLLQMLFPPFNLISKLLLVMPMVYLGEVWRLISFLIVPPLYDPFSALLNMYFYYFIGTSLESKWGARRFLLYFLLGALGAVLAALITQVGTNHFLYMSMFFAFSLLHPEQELLLFFVLPVKMKWLALFNAVYYIYMFIVGDWPQRVAMIFSLLNLFLFFGGDMLTMIRDSINHWQRKRRFQNAQRR